MRDASRNILNEAEHDDAIFCNKDAAEGLKKVVKPGEKSLPEVEKPAKQIQLPPPHNWDEDYDPEEDVSTEEPEEKEPEGDEYPNNPNEPGIYIEPSLVTSDPFKEEQGLQRVEEVAREKGLSSSNVHMPGVLNNDKNEEIKVAFKGQYHIVRALKAAGYQFTNEIPRDKAFLCSLKGIGDGTADKILEKIK